MKELIRHILKEETSRRDKLLKIVDSVGFLNASNIVGGVEKLFDVLGDDFLTDTNKIIIIKEIIESSNEEYISMSELGEEPILVNDEDGEFSQIELLYPTDVMLYHYETETGKDVDQSFMGYETLRSHILDDIFNMLVDYYINNN